MKVNCTDDIYGQLIDQIEKLERENKKLQECKDTMESEMESQVSAAVAEAVKQATAPLIEELNKAYNEIARLKSIINKDSSNSSKPSSTNGFKAIPNSRGKSDKTRGGQKGHQGHRLCLPENIEELEKEGVVERRINDYTDGSSEYISRFTIDVEMKVVITEHRFATEAKLPENLYNEVSYGDNLKATTIMLLNEGIIAEDRLSKIISGLTQGVVNLSPATMNSIQKQFAQKLEDQGELEAIKDDLQNGEVINTDDTPVRTTEKIVYPENEGGDEKPTYVQAEKKSYRATIRTHSNNQSTLYTANPKKDKKGIERDGILPNYIGILSHDHERKFYNYGTAHSTCGGHLLRELKGLRDLKNCAWADYMKEFISGMNDYKNKDLESGVLYCDPQILSSYENEYDRLINQGRILLGQMKENEFGYAEFNAMLNRLTDYKDSYMLFIRDYKAPFTNNLAERDLRPEKTKQKVSGTFRSWDGVVVHTKIRSFISTAKKRGKELLSSITKVIKGEPVLLK